MNILRQIHNAALFRNPLVILDKLTSDRKRVLRIRMKNGMEFFVHGGNSEINSLIEAFGSEGYRYLLPRIRPTDTLLDGGANTGIVSVAAKCRVFAFEPNAVLFDMFEENIRMNHAEDRIQFFPYALGAKSEERELVYIEDAYGGASFDHGAAVPQKHVKSVVETLSLKDAVSRTGESRIDFLKLDVEGAEGEILDQDLSLFRAIFVEYHEPLVSRGQIRGLLERQGFSVKEFAVPPSFYAERTSSDK